MTPGASASSHVTPANRATATSKASRSHASPSSAARSVSLATNRAMVPQAAKPAHIRVSLCLA